MVRISDGLGNQMFQYAFAYALSKRTGARVLIDPLFWGTSLRKYQLEEFEITNTKANAVREHKGRLVSDKEDSDTHGLGLANVREMVEKYSGTLDISYTETTFTVTVLIGNV